MRQVSVEVGMAAARGIYRVVAFANLAEQWQDDLQFLVLAPDEASLAQVETLRQKGLRNIAAATALGLEEGDIVDCEPDRARATVLFRESDVHHSLFLTNRCNSYCVMCSQPPTRHDDGWLVDQAIDIVRHVRVPPPVIGVSGGEPLLAAAGLERVLASIKDCWPGTDVEVLTNGRLLHDVRVKEALFSEPPANVRWLVPLYGHADFLHDFVVQSPGAFDETLDGLLTLQEMRQPIQLRIVLIQPVLDVLDELCRFIGHNLPFVECVALMACEPTGFALANRDICDLDLFEAGPALERASRVLDRYQVRHVFMNAPLCALPPRLWTRATRSISDWKNTYADDCARCTVKDRCCGLFAWHEKNWKPTKLKPIEEAIA
ncbi:His-Xaa-Ser system radical SAM maturase HxsC [Massilia litorea]|uniref:His-Xaa-Ser system radical SAM maturase HxsC n=1 Tax=Massilia litorea TaxID=2769491 RepID=A0A7L9TZD3_9BURK|nr:His-Xaa-Ser system radical SAM maturase HxsC [Massilia litorea]QOL48141.1 His-Xaa-Ser system radical SAM maturase HxsC [Massilia litorea]